MDKFTVLFALIITTMGIGLSTKIILYELIKIEPSILTISISIMIITMNIMCGLTLMIREVIKGVLKISKAGKTFMLHEREKIEVMPGEHHTAQGRETWVEVTSTPPWTPKDHILVK